MATYGVAGFNKIAPHETYISRILTKTSVGEYVCFI
jgi:hypothetical protein